MLTRNRCTGSPLIVGIGDSGVKIAPLIVGSSTEDRPQLTRWIGVRSEIYLSSLISLLAG